MAAVHQVLPVLSARDAIGAHALLLRDALRAHGWESEIFYEHATPDAAALGHPVRRFPRSSRVPTVLVYQASIGSEVANWVAARPEPLVLNYHNITPPELVQAWEPSLAAELARGARQVRLLARRSRLAVAVSEFNAADLVDAGAPATAVAPVLFDPARLGGAPDPATLDALESARRDLEVLFVGRIAPNKAQHDLLRALAAYRRIHGTSIRLHLVGGVSADAYDRTLRSYARALGVAADVDFAGSVSDVELAAHYAHADLFCCLSDHEGVCVPVLEAMHAGLPVIAYATAALPETVGSGGLLLAAKDPLRVATAWHRVASDGRLRGALVRAGHRRIAALDPARSARRMVELLEPIVRAA
jgi:glycosyltransferase involved in cell wall biosynthesis